jgi:hypothetical protein
MEMKTALVTMKMDVEEDKIDELKSIIGHHIDGFVDIDSYPEIKNIYDAKIEIYATLPLRDSLLDLFDHVNDILEGPPARDKDEEDLYAELSNIKHQLECMGYYTR